MARLLLKLGATSSQADSQGCTAFQKYVDSGEDELIDTLLDNDKMGVKTAINHLVFTGYSWNPETTSPLHSAVEHGDSVLVLKLLNAGALTQIDFDTWLKSAKVSSTHSNLGDLERSRKTYQKSMEQPLIAAIRFGNTDAALELLQNGADPNALTSETQLLLVEEYRRRWTKGTAALDLARDLIHELSKYTGEKTNTDKPLLKTGMGEYLQKLEPGTYQHWMVSKDVKHTKETFERDEKAFKKELKRVEALQGAAEKKEAVEEALTGLKAVEDALIAKGGKLFVELHPDIDAEKRTRSTRPNKRETEKPEEYKFDFRFTLDSDMNEARRDGYIEL